MRKDSYILSVISDIHTGAVPPEQLSFELEESYLKYLRSLKILDAVVITGDLFDNKLSLNSEATRHIFVFLKKLIEICIKHNAKLRIIKGTEFHDNKQLDVLKFLSNSNVDLKIFETVNSEELFEDVNVLYVPEEYVPSTAEYYKPYLDKKYDMIFGHGMINEVSFTAAKQESEITMAKAPIFKSDTLLDACTGPIFFGHIHKPQCIKDRFFYVGSFSRWSFGEEEDKGSLMVIYTPETSNFKVEFIKNKHARTFNTMVIDYNSSFYKDDENQQINYVLALVKSVEVDKLRIIFNIPEDYPNPTLLSNLLTDVFSKYKDIKIIINNNNKEARQKRETEEKVKALMNRYSFIFNKGLGTDEKISRFIQIRYNKDISVEKIRKYLYNKINE